MKTLAIYSSEVFLLSVVQSDLVVMYTSMAGFYVFENEVRGEKRKATFTYTNKKTHKPCSSSHTHTLSLSLYNPQNPLNTKLLPCLEPQL